MCRGSHINYSKCSCSGFKTSRISKAHDEVPTVTENYIYTKQAEGNTALNAWSADERNENTSILLAKESRTMNEENRKVIKSLPQCLRRSKYFMALSRLIGRDMFATTLEIACVWTSLTPVRSFSLDISSWTTGMYENTVDGIIRKVRDSGLHMRWNQLFETFVARYSSFYKPVEIQPIKVDPFWKCSRRMGRWLCSI